MKQGTFALAVAAALAFIPSARAQIVNVDFNGFQVGDVLGPTYVGSGAAGGGTVFNGVTANSSGGNFNLTVTASDLQSDTGTATPVGLTIGSVAGDYNAPGATPNNDLFRDYVFINTGGNGGNHTFTISGLGSAPTADLYFYYRTDYGLGMTITIGTETADTFTPVGIFTAGNTKYFANVPVVDGAISGTWGNGSVESLSGLTIKAAAGVPAADMSTFTWNGYTGVIDQNATPNRTVTLHVPSGTELNPLDPNPTFTRSFEATCNKNSGGTGEYDFSNSLASPLDYTVTSSDSAISNTYIVTVLADIPNVTLGISDTPMVEAGGQAIVTATLTALSSQDVTVNLAFTGTATLTTDYTHAPDSTSIVIPAGQISGSITLTGVGDSIYESPDETIIVNISSVVNALVTLPQQVIATITDPPAADFLTFSWGGYYGDINMANATVTLNVPVGTNLNLLSPNPSYTLTSGASCSMTSGGTPGLYDFTSPVEYPIKPSAGSDKVYTVTVQAILSTTPIVYESFNYTPGALVLPGKTADAGLGAWSVSGAWNADVTAPSMSYIDANGKELLVQGSRGVIALRDDPRNMYAGISMTGWSAATTDGTKLNTKGATIWFSMLAQVVATNEYTADYWQLVDSANGNAYFQFGDLRGTEWNPNTGYNKWGIQANNKNGINVVQMSTVNNHNSTFLLGRLSTDGTTGNTTFDMWFNPLLDMVPGAPGTGTVSIVLPANTDGTVTQFNMLRLIDPKWEGPSNYDEIRMGETFAAVAPLKPTLTPYSTWATANGASSDPAADSNSNGIPNGIEFFMGASPSHPVTMPAVVNTAGTITWTIPYDPAAAATYMFQLSDDLSPGGWTDVVPPDASIVVLTSPDRIQFTLPSATRKFCRLVVTPTP
ncbi:MAG: hypothetical protein NTW21_04920 [Verrucomicrobia bacterium]|nr:hypothetical protein [Verrucomicrobiota bacterium]